MIESPFHIKSALRIGSYVACHASHWVLGQWGSSLCTFGMREGLYPSILSIRKCLFACCTVPDV